MKLYNKTEQKETRRKLRQSSTHTEQLIWRRVRNSQIADIKFRRQYSIDNFIVDFYAPQVRLAIELDGGTHDSEQAKAKDAWRQRIIEGYKIVFLRFTDEEVMMDIDAVLQKIEQTVNSLLLAKEKGRG